MIMLASLETVAIFRKIPQFKRGWVGCPVSLITLVLSQKSPNQPTMHNLTRLNIRKKKVGKGPFISRADSVPQYARGIFKFG